MTEMHIDKSAIEVTLGEITREEQLGYLESLMKEPISDEARQFCRRRYMALTEDK